MVAAVGSHEKSWEEICKGNKNDTLCINREPYFGCEADYMTGPVTDYRR